jgi:hypothetical protein
MPAEPVAPAPPVMLEPPWPPVGTPASGVPRTRTAVPMAVQKLAVPLSDESM